MKMRAADLFCGAGGFSAGAEASGGVSLAYAVNHWQTAINTHQANFPLAVHRCAAIEHVDPEDCEQLNILFGSPECTHFSKARGKRRKSKSSRCLAVHVLPWIEIHRPEWFVFENVHEFTQWGPLDGDGNVIEEWAGGVFDAWIMMLQAYGYQVEYRVLNAADYGAATARERLFIVGRRGKRAPVWPEPIRTPHKSFLSVMDRQLQMRGVQSRTKPLSPNTMAAFNRGRELFGESTWIHGYYGNFTLTHIHKPLPTITTKDRFALVDASSGEFAMRMLSNKELAAAQGFHQEYVFCGTKTEVTRQIGNSVCPPVAEAITRAILSA